MYVGRYVGKYACEQVVWMYSRYKCRYIGKRQVRMYVSKGPRGRHVRIHVAGAVTGEVGTHNKQEHGVHPPVHTTSTNNAAHRDIHSAGPCGY